MQRGRTLLTALGFVALIMVSTGIAQVLTDTLYPASSLATPTSQATPEATPTVTPVTYDAPALEDALPESGHALIR